LLCFYLFQDGWNPVNDIESVIVSIRSLLAVGDGRLEAAYNMPEKKYKELLHAAQNSKPAAADGEDEGEPPAKRAKISEAAAGSYSVSEAKVAYSHLSDYHKKKGWDTSGWWARKG
jgi:ubiquitin-conjugating enzyme E2 Q